MAWDARCGPCWLTARRCRLRFRVRALAALQVVSYYGDFADMVHGLGASLLCLDFRGFGWSSGTAKLTALASDAEAVIGLLPRVKEIGEPAVCDITTNPHTHAGQPVTLLTTRHFGMWHVLAGDQPDAPVVLFGRSIGSVCAIPLAHNHPEAFAVSPPCACAYQLIRNALTAMALRCCCGDVSGVSAREWYRQADRVAGGRHAAHDAASSSVCHD